MSLGTLAPDQRAAATAPPGPVLCIAPAGSGKTTTLVGRVAWLLAHGSEPEAICAVTFNRRAAIELRQRLAVALESFGDRAAHVRVRTFHALGREILVDAGEPVEPLVDRATVLRELCGPDLASAELRRLDDGFSRLKLDLAVDGERLADSAGSAGETGGERQLRDAPGIPPDVADAFVRYERALAERGALDFDDLVRRALLVLEGDPELGERWRARCADLLVDEVQDLDRSQLRLALLLAAPENRIFLVGDDDQTIYAWRLADVRRVLALAAAIPGLRRLHLETNYRCPGAVVERSVRLVERNVERFAKRIRSGPDARGNLILAPDPGDDSARARRLLAAWPAHERETRAVLARTNAELAPYAAVAIELGIPYRAEDDGLLLDDPLVDSILDAAAAAVDIPLLVAIREIVDRIVATPDSGEGPRRDVVAGAVLQWAASQRDAASFRAAIEEARKRRALLRRDDATLTLATVHTTKGLEFDRVACAGLDEGRFPNARSIAEAPDPSRALEEERRLAYVAWTRARRSLLLVYDPGAPSPFLHEAFEPDELAVPASAASV